MKIGYARTSSTSQKSSLENQIERLDAEGCEKIFSEHGSGADRDRTEFNKATDFAREGDVFCVCKLDRFARSNVDLHNSIKLLTDKNVEFKVLDNSGIDTTTATGKLLLGILGSLAEWERAMIRERQAEGIQKAKEKGTRFGPESKLTDDRIIRIKELRNSGKLIREIMVVENLSKSSVYRALTK
ncbi:MAG: recombinase family protein [Desulfobulbia bacterium]